MSFRRRYLRRLSMTSKDLLKMRNLQKIYRAVAEMANNFNLDMNKEDIEVLLEVVPEQSTNEKLLKLDKNT